MNVYVFDLDNTLFDSFPIILTSYRDALHYVLGDDKEFNPRTCELLRHGSDWESSWKETAFLSSEAAQCIHQKKIEIYKDRLSQVNPNKNVLELVHGLLLASRIAIWTNARYDITVRLLESVDLQKTNIDIISTQSTGTPKPSLDGLISYLNEEGHDLSSVTLFDDSEAVVENAHRAGITAFLLKR